MVDVIDMGNSLWLATTFKNEVLEHMHKRILGQEIQIEMHPKTIQYICRLQILTLLIA